MSNITKAIAILVGFALTPVCCHADFDFVVSAAEDGGVIVVGIGSGITTGERNTDDWDVSNFKTRYLQPSVPPDQIRADVTNGMFSNMTTGLSASIDSFDVDSDGAAGPPSDDLQWTTIGELAFLPGDEYSLTINATFTVETLAFKDLILGIHLDAGGSSGDEIFGATTLRILETILGDVNCDGAVDLLDVEPFVAIISRGDYSVKADINEDGAVDLIDVAPFVELLSGNLSW